MGRKRISKAIKGMSDKKSDETNFTADERINITQSMTHGNRQGMSE